MRCPPRSRRRDAEAHAHRASFAHEASQVLRNIAAMGEFSADRTVARLMADRLMVMRRSEVVETGLTDQILGALTMLSFSSFLVKEKLADLSLLAPAIRD